MEAVDESQFEPSRRFFVGASLTRRAAWSVALPLAAGLALRLWLLKQFFEITGDTLIYGALAKNLLLHGRYALAAGNGSLAPSLLRLPGYPLFLALLFRLFGIENYFAVACVQIALDLASCLLLAAFVRRIAPARIQSAAALATLWLAALCPFTASYAMAPLTETPTIFMLALAMWAMARFHDRPNWTHALCFTFAVTAAALLRPEGALAAVAFAPALLLRPNPALAPASSAPPGRSSSGTKHLSRRKDARPLQPARPRLARMALVCALLALAPFAAWTWRNWQVFHVFEPLAPRTATDPGEASYPGWERWVRTWSLDFASTYDVYWNVPDGALNVGLLPNRAFDSPAQRAETAALAARYSQNGNQLTPDLDADFARLARQRIAAHPLRYYLWLPLGRVADMWLRPRVENLPIDLDWWVYAHHHVETRFSWACAGLNALYLLLAAVGLWLRPRFWQALLAYMLLRSALLLTVTAPEARYTLECFPMLFALGGIAVAAGLGIGLDQSARFSRRAVALAAKSGAGRAHTFKARIILKSSLDVYPQRNRSRRRSCMLTIPGALLYADWALLLMRLVAALVFATSGFNHLKSPRQRAQSLGMSVGFTVFLGAAELAGAIGLAIGVLTQWAAAGLILVMLGAIAMKAFKWKTGFWGEKSMGWHYDLLFIAMNLVILCSGGGRLALMPM